jgi:hypothetical protein
MLTEKQFRERARSELRQIGDEIRCVAADRDLYRKLEHEIIEPNRQLRDRRSAFFDMVRGCYVDAMTARLLRLLEPGDGDVSLHRVLEQLVAYPELLHDRISEQELAKDRVALDQAAARLRRVALPRAKHHERTLTALAATHRQIDAAVDLILATVSTYYWIVADSYIELDIRQSEDPLSIFLFAWATPAAVN